MKISAKKFVSLCCVILLGLTFANGAYAIFGGGGGSNPEISFDILPSGQQSAIPNEIVSYTFQITNTGSLQARITSISTGHTFTFGTWTFSSTLPINDILNPGDSITSALGDYQVDSFAPDGANEIATFTAEVQGTADGTGTGSANDTIDILVTSPAAPTVPEPLSIILVATSIVGLIRHKIKLY